LRETLRTRHESGRDSEIERELGWVSRLARTLTRRRPLGRNCSNGTSLICRNDINESTANGGILSWLTSFSYSPETK